jgi:hypothetical protein
MFWVLTFEPNKLQTCLAPQNDLLNLSFVKEIDVVGKKMARNGRKTAIYLESKILDISLYDLKLSFLSLLPVNLYLTHTT